jgi:hypothetical protein
MATKMADRAVEQYLKALRDPSTARDEDRIKTLQDKISASQDPVELVKLHSELARAEQADIAPLEEAFVQHAKGWAQANDVTPAAFVAVGVDPAVLRKAGFRGIASTGRRRRTTSRSSRRVSADDIRTAIPRGKFTLKKLIEKTGASAATVRRVIQEEIEAGNVEDLGEDADYSGRGRKPTLYKKI